MLYKHLITILEDYAELVPPDQDKPASHLIWIIAPEQEPAGQWLENALLLK
jgi:hypothetical protein